MAIYLISLSLPNSFLSLSITRCRDEVVMLLLESGASVSIVNNKGQTPRSLAVSHLQESTRESIRARECADLSTWKNFRLTHGDNITYGDLDSRFLDEYLDLKTGHLVRVDRMGPFTCVEPSSFESRWRGNFTLMSRNKKGVKGLVENNPPQNLHKKSNICARV